MSTLPFRYRVISDQMVNEMGVHLGGGGSLVILGAPNSGKGYVARRLREWLAHRDYGPILRVNFRRASQGAVSPKQLVDEAAQAVGLPITHGESILSSLDACERPIYLFLANPDALSRPMVRSMLHDLRSRVDDRKIVAVVRGEHDLNELVHGPSSEFNVAQPYVLQGFDLGEFPRYLGGYKDALHLAFTEEAVGQLWSRTNGVGDQVKAILTALIEKRVRPRWHDEILDAPGNQVTREEIDTVIGGLPNLGVPDRYLLRLTIRLLSLEQNRRVFDNLKRLLDQVPAPLNQPAGPPGSLTLSGLALRRDGALHFSSPLMKEVALRYFTPGRMVYFHAEAGRFREAFACSRIAPAEISWDPSILTGPLRAAAAEAHRRGAKGWKRLWCFFVRVCRNLLGLSQISLWEFRTSWNPISTPSSEMRGIAAKALELKYEDPDGGILVPSSGGTVLGWRLKGLSEAWEFAVFVGYAKPMAYPPKAVIALIRGFAKEFVEAHNRAVKTEEGQRQKDFLIALENAMEGLKREFAAKVPKLHEILKESDSLRKLGYRRIGFSLVDPYDAKIYRVYDSVDASTPPLMEFGPWRLDEPDKSVHPYVVKNRRSLVIEDAQNHAMVTQVAAKRGAIRGLAVCPILGLSEVIGTMHFERKDKTIPSPEEVADFERFGRHLGLLIEQSNLLQVLQSALDQSREAMIIFDSRSDILFANRQSGKVFGLQHGWRPRNTNSEAKAKLTEISENVYRSRPTGPNSSFITRRVDLLRPFPGTSSALSVQADQLPGWRGQPTASSVSALDLTEDYAIFEAFTALAKASDLDSGLLRLRDAVIGLGHEWARLYELRGGELVSKYQYGFEDEAKNEFENSRIKIQGKDSWRCLHEKRLIVFCLRAVPGKFYTDLGLEVEGTIETNEGIVKKNPNDYWIEAPLIADGKDLGKISIECKSDIKPERVDFLRAFFGLVSRLLESLSRARQHAFQLSMAELSHHLYTQVTWLDTQAFIYREHERAWRPDLLRIHNDSFAQGFKRISESLERAKESFSLKPPKYERFDLVKLLAEVFKQQAHIIASEESVEVVADSTYLSGALKEILCNSESFKPKGLMLWVRLREELAREVPWIELEIEDDGPGFPERLKNESAFNYFTTDRPTEQPPGTGLGLAIVKQKVELHGGTVAIATGHNGNGACIRIRIPKWGTDATLVPHKEQQ